MHSVTKSVTLCVSLAPVEAQSHQVRYCDVSLDSLKPLKCANMAPTIKSLFHSRNFTENKVECTVSLPPHVAHMYLLALFRQR